MGFIKRLFSSSLLELNAGDSFQGKINGKPVTIRVELSDDMPPDRYLRVVVERTNGRTGTAPTKLFSSSEKVVQRAIEDAFSDKVDEDSSRSLEDVVSQLNR